MIVSLMQDLIREQDPLKQGLKLGHLSCSDSVIHSRARSTKTRIETNYHKNNLAFRRHSRARSTKTRIETQEQSHRCSPMCYSRARSTKTRIETFRTPANCLSLGEIREQDPLKQGLKHHYFYISKLFTNIFASKIH